MASSFARTCGAIDLKETALGLFDLFKGKKSDGDPSTAARDAKKWADKATDKREQPGVRGEAIEVLAKMGTAEAAAILLRRFTFTIDPSITDQDEKEVTMEGIVAAGPAAVPEIRAFCEKAESVTLALRALREILPPEGYVGEVLGLLSKWDTEYAKFVDPKLQLLNALDEVKDERVAPVVLEFLEDVNETARFHAAAALVTQADESTSDPLLTAFELEESARVQKRIAEGFVKLGWKVPAERIASVRKTLPHEWRLSEDGTFSQ